MSRSKAFFINGGAGRVLCSIPAFERYAEDSGDADFIIVCEAGMDFYRGHPVLQKHAYEVWHKGLFDEHLKDKELVTPEPYRINEYFNQQCSMAQAFDIEINSLETARELSHPSIKLNKMEKITGYQTVQEIKAGVRKEKAIIIQPFGRSVQMMGQYLIDGTSRSFEVQNIISIIQKLRKEYAVIVMTEFPLPLPEMKDHPVAVPKEPNLRLWASMINSADHFLGCDSIGQHMAKALGKTATVVIGSTIPINITYLDDDNVDILDMGEEKGRTYSPIRVSFDDEKDRQNDEVMMLDESQEQRVVDSCIGYLGDGGPFKGTFIPPQPSGGCGVPPSTPSQAVGEQPDVPKIEPKTPDFSTKNLLEDG